MASKVSTWFKALSTTSKAVVLGVTGTGLLVTSGLAMSANNSTTTTPQPPQTTATPTVEIKQETKTEVTPFESQEIKDSTLANGTRTVVTKGVNGEKTITYDIEYTDGKETKRTARPEQIKPPITQVTKVGTYVRKVEPECDANYSGACVPIVSYDLDCPDIGARVYVVGTDKHGFDGNDNDGIGCESY